MYDDYTDSLEGDMSIPTAKKNVSQPGAPGFNTLDEPIKDTIVNCFFFLESPKFVAMKYYFIFYFFLCLSYVMFVLLAVNFITSYIPKRSLVY